MGDEALIRPPDLPTRFYDVRVHPDCPPLEEMNLTVGQRRTFYWLVIKLRHLAGEVTADENGVCRVDLSKTIVHEQGEFEPLGLYYAMSEDETTALILDAEPLESDDIEISNADLVTTLEKHLRAWIEKKEG